LTASQAKKEPLEAHDHHQMAIPDAFVPKLELDKEIIYGTVFIG
jgi:hypothetical protein